MGKELQKSKDKMINELKQAYLKGDVGDYKDVCDKWGIAPLWENPSLIYNNK